MSLVLLACLLVDCSTGQQAIPLGSEALDGVAVKAAYRFAADHPEVLKNIPCFCGCAAMGHRSNEDCFVKSREGGGIVWEPHGARCRMCVDIADTAIKLHDKGTPTASIRAQVQHVYGR